MQSSTPDDGDQTTLDAAAFDPHAMTPDRLATLGLGQIAYVRPGITPTGLDGIAIHAANGEVLGFAKNEETARAAALQHDLDALSVH